MKPKAMNLRGRVKKWRGIDTVADRGIDAEFSRLREALPVGLFERVLSRIERRYLLAQPFQGRGWKTWQEAWVAWHFAFFDRATHLQLAEECADDDFYLKRRGQDWVGFQVTEAMLEGRQRTKEYRDSEQSGQRIEEVSAEQIKRESDGAIPAILKALEKKSLSARGGHLVIYWNTGWLIDARRFIRDLEECSKPYRSAFKEAWLIGKGSVFQIAPAFNMVAGPPRALGSRR